MITATFLQDPNFIRVLYIIAFGLFIYGLSGLTGPQTAVRGNQLAAVGMGIAVIFGTINVVGGFLVTDRMLEMFKGKKKPRPTDDEGKAVEK